MAASIAASAAANAAFLATMNISVRVKDDGNGIVEGDLVTIGGCARQCHKFTVGRICKVEMIIALVKSPTYYLVSVVDATREERNIIYDSNRKKCWYVDDDHKWLRCKLKEIKLYVAPAVAVPTASSGASASTVQATTSGTASISINTSTRGASVRISSNGAGASASASVVPQQSLAEAAERALGKRPKYDDTDTHKKHKP